MNHASSCPQRRRYASRGFLEILAETTPQPGEPDLRGWEWHYLDRLTRPVGRSFSLRSGKEITSDPANLSRSPSQDISSVTFSADATRVAFARLEENGYHFEVWDVAKGQLVARLPSSGVAFPIPNTIYSAYQTITLSPDGRILVAQAVQKSASRFRAWEVDSGQELSLPKVLENEQGRFTRNVFPVAGGICWLESTTIPQVLGFGLPFHSGSEQVPSANLFGDPVQSPEYLLSRWDRASGQTTTHRFRPGDGNTVLAVERVSADGRIVLFNDRSMFGPGGGRRPGQATDIATACWEIAAGPPRQLWTLAGPPNSVTISPSGKMVATSVGNTATVYRAEGSMGKPQIVWTMTLSSGVESYSM